MSLPPSEIPQGAIRFNTDSQRLEFYAQDQWWVMSTDNVGIATATDVTPGTRAVFAGRETPGNTFSNDIEYINIANGGTSAEFGNLSGTRRFVGTCASSTRAVFFGGTNPGSSPGLQSTIEFVTIASTGDVTNFGSLNATTRLVGGAGNETRGLMFGGKTPGFISGIEYVTIATTGSENNYGDLSESKEACGGCSSPTRAISWGGGNPGSPGNSPKIEMMQIATLGKVDDFGELSRGAQSQSAACSNPIRGLFAGGSPVVAQIEYIEMATLGNTTNFGDLTATDRSQAAAAASPTRGIWAGGDEGGTYVTTIDFVNFSTLGNAAEFGGMAGPTGSVGRTGCSNGHGGL